MDATERHPGHDRRAIAMAFADPTDSWAMGARRRRSFIRATARPGRQERHPGHDPRPACRHLRRRPRRLSHERRRHDPSYDRRQPRLGSADLSHLAGPAGRRLRRRGSRLGRGRRQPILHTADGGLTWATQASSAPGPTDLSGVTALPGALRGTAVGKAGALLRTLDGGAADSTLPSTSAAGLQATRHAGWRNTAQTVTLAGSTRARAWPPSTTRSTAVRSTPTRVLSPVTGASLARRQLLGGRSGR